MRLFLQIMGWISMIGGLLVLFPSTNLEDTLSGCILFTAGILTLAILEAHKH
ncbi:MAG: hypothetical protein J6W27_02010 [Alphaproteobacteria bacterium]|nr:hypothetical protein [Alphaproteobacteria bacterium]